jgi:hypothetical protein
VNICLDLYCEHIEEMKLWRRAAAAMSGLSVTRKCGSVGDMSVVKTEAGYG